VQQAVPICHSLGWTEPLPECGCLMQALTSWIVKAVIEFCNTLLEIYLRIFAMLVTCAGKDVVSTNCCHCCINLALFSN